jgi:hypothetical protein
LMRQEPHPVRPFPLRTDDDIADQNGQAYHGRKTTTPNATWSAESGARWCEGHRTSQQWC